MTIPVTQVSLQKVKKQPGKTLFIDARKMGHMVDRKHRDLQMKIFQTCRYLSSIFRMALWKMFRDSAGGNTCMDIAKVDIF